MVMRTVLALLLAGGVARAEPLAPPADRSSPEHVEAAAAPRRGSPSGSDRVVILGLGAELGGSPALFGGKAGLGVLRGGGDVVARRWMGWLEVDGTDRFRPRWPADAGRTDSVLWLFPQVEYARQLVRRSLFLGWILAGPTLGSYAAGESRLWVPGVAVGAGVQWALFRVGVRYYGGWRRATVSGAGTGASGDVRVDPMVFVTAGFELPIPAVP